jgi:hypothetical protein
MTSFAPVGESREEYRAWARSWERARSRPLRIAFLATVTVMTGLALGAWFSPELSTRWRAFVVADATDDVADCCRIADKEDGSFPASCVKRLKGEAGSLRRAEALEELAFALVAPVRGLPPSRLGESHVEAWEACPELAVTVAGLEPSPANRKAWAHTIPARIEPR